MEYVGYILELKKKLIYLFESQGETHTDNMFIHWLTPLMLAVADGAETWSWEHNSDLPYGQQEPNHLSNYCFFPGCAGIWSQELELAVEPRHSNVG